MSVAPTRPKGPPLNAMRAFEAAARHGSFVVAAEELSVTPGAISQHIKTLENWAGAKLFHRNAQGVRLTAPGRSLVKSFTEAFDALADATHALRNLRPNCEIHIAALPSVAQLWLPPRLGKIRAALPHVNISVTALESPPNLSRELFDLSIFFTKPASNADVLIIAADEIAPTCSPAQAEKINNINALNSARLLHDRTWREDWTIWSTLSGVPIDAPYDGAHYSLYSLAVEEAKSGAGVLIGHICLIEDALKAGTLVLLGNQTYANGHALTISLPPSTQQRPELAEIAGLLQCEGPPQRANQKP